MTGFCKLRSSIKMNNIITLISNFRQMFKAFQSSFNPVHPFIIMISCFYLSLSLWSDWNDSANQYTELWNSANWHRLVKRFTSFMIETKRVGQWEEKMYKVVICCSCLIMMFSVFRIMMNKCYAPLCNNILCSKSLGGQQ